MKPKTCKQHYTTITTADEEIDVRIDYRYTPGCAAIGPAYDHGGIPGDPPEVDIIAAMNADTLALVELDEDTIEEITGEIIDAEESAEPDDTYEPEDDQ